MIGGIAAGIVVFNAEKERLENNISRLKKQVKDVYIFDNSNVSDGDYDGVTYLSENKNCGIAYALNRIMEQAKADGYKWLITMDQDSLIPDGMVHGFEESIRTHENIGIICPQVIDRRRTYLQAEDNEAEEYVNFCITSASCTSIEAWENCGKFDEWMFIQNQVTTVLIFDNGSNNVDNIQNLILGLANVVFIKSEKNLGIAAALNRLMQWGNDKGYDWMLSLDQDSVCEENFVARMKPYLTIEQNLGVVAPVIVDRNVGVVGHNPKSEYMHVNTCITSGAFSKVSAWKKIGEYDESMFIDSVDFEYCYRMRKCGYGVIQVRDVQLLHELGKSQKRRLLFWKIDVTGHSAFRKYYIARNNVYYPLKHRMWLRVLRGNIRNIGMMGVTVLYKPFLLPKGFSHLPYRMSPKSDFYPSKKALTYKGGSNVHQMNPPSTLLFHLFSSSDSLL